MDADFNEWNEEDPFKEYDYDEDCLEIEPIINKYHIHNKELSKIDDYGIYDYFMYCDTYKKAKMIADIHSGSYIINTADGDTDDHLGMTIYNQSMFGRSNCYIGSFCDEVNVFSNAELTSNQYHVLIGVFNELKKYYLETNRNKKIAFIGTAFGNELDNFKDCSNIDELIVKLTELEKSAESEQQFLFSTGHTPLI